MIIVEINKEVKRENRIFGKFNLRQATCFGIAAVILVLVYIIVRPSVDYLMVLGIGLGVVAWYLGFHKKDGIYMEYFLWKNIKEKVLQNKTRTYRCKNSYVSMMNEAYTKERNLDMADKKKKKEIKKRAKIVEKNKKKTTLKAYK